MNPALAQPAAPSCSSGQDFSLPKGLGMVEIPLVAGSIIPQDKGWWDQLHCVTRGQEVEEGQVSAGLAWGLPVLPWDEVWVCASGNTHGQQTTVGSGHGSGQTPAGGKDEQLQQKSPSSPDRL